ncbi:hypothetical protein P3T76_010664 [Phytophthora citrophthora]|uniref:RWP-RK domain-containing protein n=1 Tax=Phytophthora citrophthora TaxID=4793 RepID=A0AAD9LHD6_9STRA|nr:hypothetical protein P3T76_010663 [Phytophthora citrophthora]KAK1935439.1 hypothetical protein P3T76_010664 [Phytophthora citrophthora]
MTRPNGRLAPVPLVSALISKEAVRPERSLLLVLESRAPRPADATVGTSHLRIRPVPHNQVTPQHKTPKYVATTMMSSMSPFPAASSTFNVVHPLHGTRTVFCPQSHNQSVHMSIDTCTPLASPSQLVSPTMSCNKMRVEPAVSPNKKARKSRVVFDFTTDEMAKYFHMSQREAAQQLGVATVTVKRNCRRLGIVWPYRLMKSKKYAIDWSAISREDAQRIRQECALERAKAGRSPSSRSRSRSRSTSSSHSSDASDDEAAAKVITMLSSSSSNSGVDLTEAGRAFARLPLDCMDCSN